MGRQATVRRAASTGSGLVGRVSRSCFFYELFNTPELNAAIYPTTCNTM